MYEEYMQNIMGMQMNPYQDIYGNQAGYMQNDNLQEGNQIPYWYSQPFNNPIAYGNGITYKRQIMEQEDLESMYPDIYNIIYPMVKKVCDRNVRPITRELIDDMAQDIYSNIEADNILNLNINVQNIGNETNTIRTEDRSVSNNKKENTSGENRCPDDRQIRRGPIFDLIKILLLRELIGRRPCRPGECGPRPPRPPMHYPPRPPMPRY